MMNKRKFKVGDEVRYKNDQLSIYIITEINQISGKIRIFSSIDTWYYPEDFSLAHREYEDQEIEALDE